MNKHIALIGCGIWGRKILRDLKSLGCRVDVYDSNTAMKDDVLADGADHFYPAGQNIAPCDGIIIATPSTTHRELVEAYAALNIPIFLEKPLTTSLNDALALQKLNTDHIFLMHVWLYHPGINLLSEIRRSGELGQVKTVRSFRCNWTSPRKDTDTIWNLTPHDITIAKAILGYLPEPRSASIEYHEEVPRGMVGILGDGPQAIFEVSNRYERKIREVRVHFSDGIALLPDEHSDHLVIIHGDHKSDLPEIEHRPFDQTPALYRELEEFISFLDGGDPPRSPFDDGLEVIQTIDTLVNLAGKA